MITLMRRIRRRTVLLSTRNLDSRHSRRDPLKVELFMRYGAGFRQRGGDGRYHHAPSRYRMEAKRTKKQVFERGDLIAHYRERDLSPQNAGADLLPRSLDLGKVTNPATPSLKSQ